MYRFGIVKHEFLGCFRWGRGEGAESPLTFRISQNVILGTMRLNNYLLYLEISSECDCVK